MRDRLRAEALAEVGQRRGEQGVEVADAVGFLASPAARFVTGTVLHVNGGACRTR